MFLPEQRADRAPVLVGLEVRSHDRVKEERYKMFAARLATGDPNSGITPQAHTGGEYILKDEAAAVRDGLDRTPDEKEGVFCKVQVRPYRAVRGPVTSR